MIIIPSGIHALQAFIATLVHLSHQTTADWRHMTLDADDKFNVSWTANNETITFKVTAYMEKIFPSWEDLPAR